MLTIILWKNIFLWRGEINPTEPRKHWSKRKKDEKRKNRKINLPNLKLIINWDPINQLICQKKARTSPSETTPSTATKKFSIGNTMWVWARRLFTTKLSSRRNAELPNAGRIAAVYVLGFFSPDPEKVFAVLCNWGVSARIDWDSPVKYSPEI